LDNVTDRCDDNFTGIKGIEPFALTQGVLSSRGSLRLGVGSEIKKIRLYTDQYYFLTKKEAVIRGAPVTINPMPILFIE